MCIRDSDTVVHIHDGEHDAVPELVPSAPFLQRHQACILKKAVLIPLSLQVAVQIITGLIGIPQSEMDDGLIRQPPLKMEIIIGCLARCV